MTQRHRGRYARLAGIDDLGVLRSQEAQIEQVDLHALHSRVSAAPSARAERSSTSRPGTSCHCALHRRSAARAGARQDRRDGVAHRGRHRGSRAIPPRDRSPGRQSPGPALRVTGLFRESQYAFQATSSSPSIACSLSRKAGSQKRRRNRRANSSRESGHSACPVRTLTVMSQRTAQLQLWPERNSAQGVIFP